MYQPPANLEERREVILELIRQHPLGLLISAGSDGLQANSVPFVLKVGPDQSITLECHLAIANPQWREFEGGEEVLVVFQGPQAYVTPTWYPAKREHGKVVPTWNYVVVQVKGTAFTVDDPDWLSTHLSELTDHNERDLKEPWRVSDAPSDYVRGLMKGIKGVRIQVSSVAGKWKLSQNRSLADREGVIRGLSERGGEAADVAALMALQLTTGTADS